MAECHPVGFQWVMEAKARGATVIHVDPRFTRTSAVADLHVPLRAGYRHRLPRRDHQLRPAAREVLPRVRGRLHQRRDDRQRGLPPTPRTSTACSPAWTASTASTTRAAGSTRALEVQAASGERDRAVRGPGAAAASVRQAARGEAHGSGGADVARRGARARRDAAAPALRLPDPQAALRPLHAGDGRADLRRAAGAVPAGVRAADRELRAGAHHRVRLQRGLDPAHRRRAVHPHRRRSCRRCSATSAAPAAASWRCAGTPPSRAPPTSRRCSTCCPATSRCRTRTPTQDLDSFVRGRGGDEGLLGRTCAPTR